MAINSSFEVALDSKKTPKLVAILGPTASGKSALAMELVSELESQKIKAAVFSLDSLAIYKYIDIASAKPSADELKKVKHFGVDVLEPSQKCDAILIKKLLESAIDSAPKFDVLFIVGGSSFYLKSIIEGLSDTPKIEPKKLKEIQQKIQNLGSLESKFEELKKLDSATKILPSDTYRITKHLEICYASNMPASRYFATHPKSEFPHKIDLFCLEIGKEILWQNIQNRTQKMLENGLLDEVKFLLKNYPKNSPPFRAIGIKESIDFLESRIDSKSLKEQIIIHTRQLAKRQKTFNKTQFLGAKNQPKNELKSQILQLFKGAL